VFGPQPRDYSFKLNKKLKQTARLSAIAYKLKNNQVVVVEDFNLETPKTKEFISILKNLNVADKRSLVVVSDVNNNVYLSGRNLQHSDVLVAGDLNTYQIMKAHSLVLSENSVQVIQEILSK
jgi:large subunit ribosomal protein L4